MFLGSQWSIILGYRRFSVKSLLVWASVTKSLTEFQAVPQEIRFQCWDTMITSVLWWISLWILIPWSMVCGLLSALAMSEWWVSCVHFYSFGPFSCKCYSKMKRNQNYEIKELHQHFLLLLSQLVNSFSMNISSRNQEN